MFLKCMAIRPQTTVTVNYEARGSRQKLIYDVAVIRFGVFFKTECLLMVHELIVSKLEFFHTEGMDSVSSQLLSPFSPLPLLPTLESFSLGLEQPRRARENFFANSSFRPWYCSSRSCQTSIRD